MGEKLIICLAIGFLLIALVVLVCTWLSYFFPSLAKLDVFRPMRRACMRRYQEDWDWARKDIRRRRGQEHDDGEGERKDLRPGTWAPRRDHRSQ